MVIILPEIGLMMDSQEKTKLHCGINIIKKRKGVTYMDTIWTSDILAAIEDARQTENADC